MHVLMRDALVNSFTNVIDILNFSLMFCAFTSNKIRLKRNGIILGLLWGISLGLIVTFFNMNLHKFIAYGSMLVVIHLLYDNLLHDAFVLFMLISTYVIGVQVLTVVVTFLPVHQATQMIIGQIITLIVTIVVYLKTNPSKIANLIIDDNLTAKIIFYITSLFLFGGLVYFDFNATKIRPLLLLYVVLIIIALAGLKRTEKLVKYCANNLPLQHHDMVNALMGINGIINDNESNNLIDLRKGVNKYLMDVGVMPYDNEGTTEEIRESIDKNQKARGKNILDAIEEKKQEKDPSIKIQMELFNYSITSLMPESDIIKALNLLLDNAIMASNKNDIILLKLYVTENHGVVMEVANPCNQEKYNWEKMMKKDFKPNSTDEERQGYGLYELNKLAKKYKGRLKYTSEYIEKMEKRYCIFRYEINPYKEKNALRRALS